MTEERRSWWSRLFKGSGHSSRREKVLEYIVYRMGEGVDLREVLAEEYVLRNLSPREREEIAANPRLVEAARERMQKDLSGRPGARRTREDR